MGNDHSQLRGLEIDQKSVEVTDFWALYTGEISNDGSTTLISIFQGEPFVKGQLWANHTPLDRTSRNLMIFRHPSILKFITSWERGSLKFLATERCKPLLADLSSQSDVQICLGLRSILCSLVFLMEQATVKHLNISSSTIYVTQDGAWKLAGFEHLWQSKEINVALMEKSQPYRYKPGVDPNELKHGPNGIEQYAFAVLCEEILKNVKEDTMPHVSEFKKYCSAHLKHSNVTMRPKLSAVLLHPYFNHEFVLIHSFLSELPLKGQLEKQQFFTGLVDRLRDFDEENVAVQLAGLLLSRMVLLDATAQLCVTPFVLKPKVDDMFPSLFTSHTFTKHIIPKLMKIFCVRDAQIRLILLEYFSNYMSFFTLDDLKDQLLPQLLLGIKDTNDILVAATLRCLADLVPVLGSAVVVGRNRGRLFADGRPQGLPDSSNHWIEHRSITPVMNSGEFISGSPMPDHVDISESYASANNQLMPERLSPDGGEDVLTTSEVLELEDDAWSDWETDVERNYIDDSKTIDHVAAIQSPPYPSRQVSSEPVNFIKDIKEMEIKSKPQESTEVDFFKDMEPVIQKTNVMLISDICENDRKCHSETVIVDATAVVADKSRFEIKLIECETDGTSAWDDDVNAWEDD